MTEPFGKTLDELPDEVRRLLVEELDEGEEILWVDQPIPRRFAYRQIGTVLFGLLWTTFSLATTIAVLTGEIDGDLHPIGTPLFLVIGATLIASPLWALRNAKRMAYALTPRRVIVVHPSLMRGAVESYAAADLVHPTWTSWQPGDYGSIEFANPRDTSCGDPDGPWLQFNAISNVRRVKDLVKSVAAEAATTGREGAPA